MLCDLLQTKMVTLWMLKNVQTALSRADLHVFRVDRVLEKQTVNHLPLPHSHADEVIIVPMVR